MSRLTMMAIFLIALPLMACQTQSATGQTPADDENDREGTTLSEPLAEGMARATLAGGCFWCMQSPFESLDGVQSVTMGYTGGDQEHPTYRQVASGQTDHLEAVEIRYDPERIDFEKILDVFWQSIDPTDDGGQFADRGDHYRTAIFYHDDEQRQIAERSRAAFDEEGPFDEPVVTAIREASDFWVAEDYHQDYYKKNPERYERYYRGSGRPRFFDETWQ